MKAIVLILFALLPTLAWAQKEANHWYFGIYGGLDFSNGSPVTDGNSAMATDKGCAVISDTSGNLLFYANSGDLSLFSSSYSGVVCNRNHQVMPNGYLGDTCGLGSTFQSTLIIPKVGSQRQFYLFTLDDIWGLNRGLRYSIVDMTLDGGLGDVKFKAVPVVDSVLTGMAATRHANGTDYWLMVKKAPVGSLAGTFHYYAYKIDSSGIHPPVITPEDPLHDFHKLLKFSPDGSLLYSGNGIYAFDNATGQLSGFKTLHPFREYDCGEFSPNSKVLYAYTMGSTGFVLEQFDLTTQDLASSSTLLDAHLTGLTYKSAMQLGPDKKIYLSYLNGKVSVIEDPNVLGTGCNLVVDQITVTGNLLFWEFPNFISSYLGDGPVTSNPEEAAQSSVEVKVFPNPFTTTTRIEIPRHGESTTFLQLFSAQGQLIREFQVTFEDHIEVEKGNLAAGLYYFTLSNTQEKLGTGKLIVQ